VIGEAMALTDGIAVVAIEQGLLFLPDNQRIQAAIFENIGFELGASITASATFGHSA
jgi:hypothetical protein